MPITYTVLKNGGVLVEGRDAISGSEIKAINDAIYESPENVLKTVLIRP